MKTMIFLKIHPKLNRYLTKT